MMIEQKEKLSGKAVLCIVSLTGLVAILGAFHSPYWLYALGFSTPHLFFSSLEIDSRDLIRILAPAYAIGVILFSILASQIKQRAFLWTLTGLSLYALDAWAAFVAHLWVALPVHLALLLLFIVALKNEYLNIRRAKKKRKATPPPRLSTVINKQMMIGRPGLATRKPYDDEDDNPLPSMPAVDMKLRPRTYHGRWRG